jgi:uracil phosphoribosyltransferase
MDKDSMVFIADHPLIKHKLTIMRDKNTGSKDFRHLLEEITMLMCYELTSDVPTIDVTIETPISKMTTQQIEEGHMAVIPILRAGLGMVEGILNLMPVAKVGHIGMYRDPATHKPVEYYCKLPEDIETRYVIVCDPMLATGGSASDAITLLKQRGCKMIKFLCLVAAPEGVEKLRHDHPDVKIYAAALDERLNENAYIVPGLGDAGDRLFGTM